MRKIFVYAAEKQAWQEYPAGAEEQIAKFPVNCIFPEEPHYNSSWRHRKNRCNTALLCWCDKHKKNEQLIMTDNGINSAKCHALKGAAAFFKKEIPIHWEMMPEDIDPKNYTFEPSKKNKPTIISAAKEAWKNFEKELFPTPIEYRGFNRHGIAAYAWMLEQQGATELIVTAELIDIRRNIYCTSRNTIMGQSRLQPTRRALRVIYDMRTGGKR